MFKYSQLTRLDNKNGDRRISISAGRSKSQPNFYIRPAMSASLQSFMATNTKPPKQMNSRSSNYTLSVPKQQFGAKRDSAPPQMSSSYASSINGSSPNGSIPEHPARFNPFSMTSSQTGSNLTINTEDSNSIIFDEDGELVSAGPEALWNKLLPTRDYSPSRRLVFSLLLNLRNFVSPAEILQKLVQNCIFEQNTSSSNFHKRTRTKLFEHVFEFIEEWTSTIPYDFVKKEMRDRLTELYSICTTDAQDKLRFDHLMDNLLNAITKREHYEQAIRSLRPNVEETPEKSSEFYGLACLDATPRIVAEQLAQIEMERLSMIGPDEIVEMLSTSSLENLQQPKDGNLNDIRHYIDWFNQLTRLVATEILRHQHKKHRVKCIEFFIDLGKECINTGNFNSLMAIVAALTIPAVSRLKRTWCRVEKSKLEILQHQLNPSGNFVSYRSTLNAAIWRFEGAKNDAERVIIPFFGLLLKDLYFIERACLEPISNGHLNLAMFSQFADHMSNLIKWKSRTCPFKRNAQVLQYLLLAATYSEKNMLLLSYEYESPANDAERDQHKKFLDEQESK